jgi:hypothetical protein
VSTIPWEVQIHSLSYGFSCTCFISLGSKSLRKNVLASLFGAEYEATKGGYADVMRRVIDRRTSFGGKLRPVSDSIG